MRGAEEKNVAFKPPNKIYMKFNKLLQYIIKKKKLDLGSVFSFLVVVLITYTFRHLDVWYFGRFFMKLKKVVANATNKMH